MSDQSSDRERHLIIWAAAEARRLRRQSSPAAAVAAPGTGGGGHRRPTVAVDVGVAVDWQLTGDGAIASAR